MKVDMATKICYFSFKYEHMLRGMEDHRIYIVRQLLRLGAFIQREGDRLAGAYGLNQQQFVVLKEIQEKGQVTQKEICSEFLFEKSHVSKIIKKLKDAGLISMSASSDDGRSRLCMITAKGERTVKECMKQLNRWNRSWLGPLSKSDLKETYYRLDKLVDIIK